MIERTVLEPLRISVVIATRRRTGQLQECLRSLDQQTLHQGWEVIVVQDDEEEPLDPAIEQIVARAPVRYFQQPHAGCGPARDRGAREAQVVCR
jgi:glycosyltransferase involved in cell wall biosynthesis